MSSRPDYSRPFAITRPIVDRIAGDVLELGCGKWPSLEICDAQLKDIMQQLRAVQFKNQTELNRRFMMGPILKIADRMVN